MHVFVVDLVLPDRDFDLGFLGEAEIPILDGPRIDERGRAIVTIRATGKGAAVIAESYGVTVEPHAVALEGVRFAGEVERTFGSCGGVPPNSPVFSRYDAPDAFAVSSELRAMAAIPNVGVRSLARTSDRRDVLAVRVGPRIGFVTDPPAPAVILVGTHHAREWASEEVALRLTRWATEAVNNPARDPDLFNLLGSRALVFVPVVNPDGYEYSHTNFRDQRKNRRSVTCFDSDRQGVDLNRNYATGWGGPADSGASDDCYDDYVGPAPASEPEVVGMQLLLSGRAFAQDERIQTPVAAITYHTYANLVLYPNGFKPTSDAEGPACNANSNCMHSDMQGFRRLFGDTEAPRFFDHTVTPPYAYPASQLNNLLYSATGDMTMHASGMDPGLLAITPELTKGDIGFYIECEPDAERIINDLVEDQKRLIIRLLREGFPLAERRDPSKAFLPTTIGGYSAGVWVREASAGAGHDTARPRFLKGVWRPIDPGSMIANVGGNLLPMTKTRRGVHYRSYSFDAAALPDPWCLPCEIRYGQQDGGDGGIDCRPERCIDLRDENRLPHVGWHLQRGDRGGQPDFWWAPDEDLVNETVLSIPGGIPPAGASHCQLMFTTEWDPRTLASPVILERQTPGGWREIERWPLGGSGNLSVETRRAARLRSELIETNAGIAGGLTDSFRFRVPAGDKPNFKLFEPVVYCRIGAVP